MPFAQLVLGTAGAGKSTYCDGMQQFMSAIGRKCSVVNLDPANDHNNYEPAIDVRELVNLEEIMKDDKLGPNGGVLFAIEELEHNVDWLEKRLNSLGEDYVIFDCPGQAELFTHHASLRNIFFRIQKLGYRVRYLNRVDPVLRRSAGRPQSSRLILFDPSFTVYLEHDPFIARNATDGSPTSQRFDED
jgi:GTPase SAR1 family protein